MFREPGGNSRPALSLFARSGRSVVTILHLFAEIVVLNSTRVFYLATAACVISLAEPAAAQQSPARLGLVTGVSIPMSDYGRDKNVGYHLGLVVDVRVPTLPLGLRFDGDFHQMGYKGSSTNAQIWMLNGNLVLRVPTPTPVHPYLIGGAGVYNSHRTLFLATAQSRTDLGLNGGAGLRYETKDVIVFVEARYHAVSGNGPRVVPITIGALF
jgi:hypothetical protein